MARGEKSIKMKKELFSSELNLAFNSISLVLALFFPNFKFDLNFDPQKIGSYEHNGNSEFPL